MCITRVVIKPQAKKLVYSGPKLMVVPMTDGNKCKSSLEKSILNTGLKYFLRIKKNTSPQLKNMKYSNKAP